MPGFSRLAVACDPADGNLSGGYGKLLTELFYYGCVAESVPGKGYIVKGSLGDFCQDDLFLEATSMANQDSGSLSHSLDYQGGRHYGIAGEMVVHVLAG